MNFFVTFISKVIAKKNMIFRFLTVWLLGLLIFSFDEKDGHDLRFQLRSPQPIDSRIAIINISKKDWDMATNPGFSSILKSARPLSDSYFWSTPLWAEIFRILDLEDPKVVAVDLFFDRSVPLPSSVEERFKLPRVIWRAETDERFGYRLPRFAINYQEKNRRSERFLTNVGLGFAYKGYDNIARTYLKALTHTKFLRDIPDKIVHDYYGSSSLNHNTSKRPFINYRGEAGTYPVIDLTDLLLLKFPKDYFKNKIVLIGSDSMKSHFIKTPIGFMSRTEYHANVIDNILNDLWITSFNNFYYFFYLFIIALFSFLALGFFRQGLATSFLILLCTFICFSSIMLFDIFNIWIPIVSPIAIVLLSYVFLLNQLLTESEYYVWKVQKREEAMNEMNELKNNFVSLFSHDLKTPLAKIHAISNKLLQTKNYDDSNVQTELGKIQKETKELNRYIQSILQVTRIEAGEFNLNIVPNDINELIKECAASMTPLAQEKGIHIEIEEEPLFPVEFDSVLIKEVFNNIIDNCVKYCPPGTTLKILSQDIGENIAVTFSDNGPGIAETDQSAIFEKFYRSPSTPIDKKGTGLGLYLVRYFIEIHNGTVNLESSPGKGTSFLIKLPYVQKT